jgi:membrane protein involved in colicin uptake
LRSFGAAFFPLLLPALTQQQFPNLFHWAAEKAKALAEAEKKAEAEAKALAEKEKAAKAAGTCQ